VVAGVFTAGAAFAQSSGSTGVDTTAVVASLTSNAAALTAVGGAIIGTLVIAVGYKWVKGMMFG
jgi:hypothetical protein